MIAHLSPEQLSECILSQAAPLVAEHLQSCPTCRSELAGYREALGDFRGAVRAWSEEQANAALLMPDIAEPQSWLASHQFAWALLIAAICILASIVIPRHNTDRAPSRDAVLLDQVDTEVSRTVPSSMEPLMRLVVQNQ